MKTIVITGCTSGIGHSAAEHLLARGHRVIGGTCDPGAPPAVEQHPLQLADLNSVRTFASKLSNMQIGALVLNAGVQAYNVDAKTIQGYERTFGINHLAHYLLARLLLPQLADGGAIIFTTSATHDPAEKIGLPTPRHTNTDWLAHPEHDPNLDRKPITAGLRAYTTSKLCNIMTAQTLSRQPEAIARNLRIHAYDPGLVAGTGLVRTGAFPLRHLIWPILSLLNPILKGSNTLTNAGQTLANLAEAPIDTGGHIYCSLRKAKLVGMPPSLMAQNTTACEHLWHESAELVSWHTPKPSANGASHTSEGRSPSYESHEPRGL